MLNKVYLIGNVGHAPDIRVLQDGREIALFSVATQSYQKDKEDSWQRHTEWYRITVFQSFYMSWIKDNVRKGDSLLIEGKLSYLEWEDDSKNKRKTAHILISGREGRLHRLNTRKKEDSPQEDPLQEPLQSQDLLLRETSSLLRRELSSAPSDDQKTGEVIHLKNYLSSTPIGDHHENQ